MKVFLKISLKDTKTILAKVALVFLVIILNIFSSLVVQPGMESQFLKKYTTLAFFINLEHLLAWEVLIQFKNNDKLAPPLTLLGGGIFPLFFFCFFSFASSLNGTIN